jgi:hypothetical protein
LRQQPVESGEHQPVILRWFTGSNKTNYSLKLKRCRLFFGRWIYYTALTFTFATPKKGNLQ